MYDISPSYFLLFYYIWSIHMIYQAHADDSEILTIAEDSCRYEVHTSCLPWDEALQACKHRGMTLVSLSGTLEAKSLYDLLKTGDSMFSDYVSLSDRSYWIGLHMESSSGGSSEFQWGNCVVDTLVTDVFSSLTDYSSATGCGYLSDSSVRMTPCSSSTSLGFICEGVNSCFTTQSTTFLPLGFSSEVTANSRDCASSCLAKSTCAGVHVSSGSLCTLLTYDTDLPSSLQPSDLMSSHFHHKRLLYHGGYSSLMTGLNEEALCNISVWTPPSPIVTTTVSQGTSVEEITPTPTFATTGDNLSESLQTAEESATTDPVNTSTTTEEIDGVTVPDSSHTTAKDETTVNECVTNLTITDIQSTPEHTTSNSDIYAESTTTTTTVIETQHNESVIVYNLSSCVCVCRYTNDTLEERIEKITSELKLDIKGLSSSKNRRISADDPRPSAKHVGIIGIFILCCFGVLSVGMDIVRILQHCDKKCKRNKIQSGGKP